MRPGIKIRLDHPGDQFFPGDVLVCEYEIKIADHNTATAVETSVLWTTTGKGEEDFGVHFFERRPKSMLNARNLSRPHRISTVLPQSPLSYDGTLIQIRWSVKLRVFVSREQFTSEYYFRLGDTTLPTIESPSSDEAAVDRDDSA